MPSFAEQPHGPHARTPKFPQNYFFLSHFLQLDFTDCTRRGTGGGQDKARRCKNSLEASGCIVLVWMQKGGVRGSKAGNHPQGRGWGRAAMLKNKVRVTFWCRCHLFRARSSPISDRNRCRLLGSANSGVILPGRRVNICNKDLKKTMWFFRPILIVHTKYLGYHMVKESDSCLPRLFWIRKSFTVLCKRHELLLVSKEPH